MTKRELLRNGAQLAGLWGLAVAQPLFGLTKSGEAFVLGAWRGGDVVFFALAVAFGPPALMVAAEALAGWLRAPLAAPLHLLFVGGICAILALYVVKHQTDFASGVALVVGLAAGAGGAYLFHRFEPVRSFATVISLSSILFVALFLFGSPVRYLVFPSHGADLSGAKPATPVVMVVFDEFPELSLLDGHGELDRASYPAFAQLARDGITFSNAATVADHTVAAIPAILTGRQQDGHKPASVSAIPDNLLALFARRGGVAAQESQTRLCPPDACPDNRPTALPGRVTRVGKALVKLSLATFLPNAIYQELPATHAYPRSLTIEQKFARLWASFRSSVAFRFLYLQLPHQPWYRLPSGKPWFGFYNIVDYLPDLPRVQLTGIGLPVFVRGQRWTRDPNLVTSMLQRHLAQAQYADKLLGQTLQRLRSSGLYDRSLIVVTADHGVALQPDVENRRLSRANVTGIVPVPLIVKLPHQHRGSVSDRFVKTTDIAPTIAAVLRLRLPWRTDGRSLLQPGPPVRRLVVNAIATDRRLVFDPSTLARQLRAGAAHQAALLPGSGPDHIFRAGRYGNLIGTPAGRLAHGAPVQLRYTIAGGPRILDLAPHSRFIPALIGGLVSGPRAVGRELGVVLNGRLAAMTVTHRSGAFVRFEAFVAEHFFRTGRNHIEVYAVTPGPAGPRFSKLPSGS